MTPGPGPQAAELRETDGPSGWPPLFGEDELAAMERDCGGARLRGRGIARIVVDEFATLRRAFADRGEPVSDGAVLGVPVATSPWMARGTLALFGPRDELLAVVTVPDTAPAGGAS